MASIQDSLAKAVRHLGEMTLSQRMAIALGALLVVGSIAWLAQWAATPEMSPLLPGQNLEPEDLAQLRAGLETLGEPYRIEGSQVMVRAGANRSSILASLQQAEKLPTDMAIGFAELVKEANPWISQAENDRRWTVALQSELARTLREFTGVKKASVLLNLHAKRGGWSLHQPESSASVTLFMRGGEPVGRPLALAAARQVAGAVRGLKVENVQVIDGSNGRVALDWETEQSGSANQLHNLRKQVEREKAEQIKQQLSFDLNALVSVSADLDFSTKQVQDSSVTEGAAVKEQNESTSTIRNRLSGQPGVQPNVGLEVGAGGAGDTSTTEHNETLNEPSRRSTLTQTPAGVPTNIRAAISLSYGYLAGIYRLNNPTATEGPTEQQIEEVFVRQKDRITERVAKLLVPPTVEQVSIDWHYEAVESIPTVEAATLDVSMDLARKYGPFSGLALLALLALGMMMKLAKKRDDGESFGLEIGLPAEAIEAAREAAKDLESVEPQKAAGRGTGGSPGLAEAVRPAQTPFGTPADGVLEAHEVDENTVRVGHMISQVAEMAEKDGESVASLVQAWIEESH